MRDTAPVVDQGVTTIVIGQDGQMTFPVKGLFESHAEDTEPQ